MKKSSLVVIALFVSICLLVAFMPLTVALIPKENQENQNQISKQCFSFWNGSHCFVPVKTAWGSQLGWYGTNESDGITECVYSSGNWFIDAISFKSGKDYSRSFLNESNKFSLESKSKFSLVCRVG